jgi:hypothetical protein
VYPVEPIILQQYAGHAAFSPHVHARCTLDCLDADPETRKAYARGASAHKIIIYDYHATHHRSICTFKDAYPLARLHLSTPRLKHRRQTVCRLTYDTRERDNLRDDWYCPVAVTRGQSRTMYDRPPSKPQHEADINLPKGIACQDMACLTACPLPHSICLFSDQQEHKRWRGARGYKHVAAHRYSDALSKKDNPALAPLNPDGW